MADVGGNERKTSRDPEKQTSTVPESWPDFVDDPFGTQKDSPNQAKTDSAKQVAAIPTGQVQATPPFRRTVIIVAVFFCLTVVGVLLLGIANRLEWRTFTLLPSGPPSVTFVQSANGVVIMQESGRGYSRILVRKANTPGWLLISTDDLEARNPALAPNGNVVAYLSAANGGNVVATSLEKDSRVVISPQAIDGQSLKPMAVAQFSLCPWTNVAWSPSSDRIAFFACAVDPTLSYVVIAGITSTGTVPALIDSSYLASENASEVMWLTDNRIIVNRLPLAGQASVETTEYTVP